MTTQTTLKPSSPNNDCPSCGGIKGEKEEACYSCITQGGWVPKETPNDASG